MSRLRTGLRLASLAAFVLPAPVLAHEPAGGTGLPAVQAQAHDPLSCFCRAQGRTFAVGETACLRTGEGPRVAECGMVLNNTSWQFTARPCPES